MTRALVTGAAGFIGSHFLRYFVEQHPDWEFVVIDRLSYAADLNRISGVDGKIEYVFHDIRAFPSPYVSDRLGELDYVFHLAAETHVDRSATDPEIFVQSNIIGTFNLLEFCRLRQKNLKCFFLVSTDEVFGAAPHGVDHTEDFPHRPSNVYSATKAAAEDLAYAYDHSMGVPVIVTNTMNNIGPDQDAEKYLPLIVRKILRGDMISVHGSPTNPGSRKYLHARDHAAALDFLVERGERGQRYNVVGVEEIVNIAMVRRVEMVLENLWLSGHRNSEWMREFRWAPKAYWQWMDFHNARKGHDLRYSLDGSKLAAMGWKPKIPVDQAIEEFVCWALANPKWWRL